MKEITNIEEFNKSLQQELDYFLLGKTITKIECPQFILDQLWPRALIIQCGDTVFNMMIEDIKISNRQSIYQASRYLLI